MADEADHANDQIERAGAYLVADVCRAAARIPAGEPGNCRECGDEMPRLVNGRCAPCRDQRTKATPRLGRELTEWPRRAM